MKAGRTPTPTGEACLAQPQRKSSLWPPREADGPVFISKAKKRKMKGQQDLGALVP